MPAVADAAGPFVFAEGNSGCWERAARRLLERSSSGSGSGLACAACMPLLSCVFAVVADFADELDEWQFAVDFDSTFDCSEVILAFVVDVFVLHVVAA